MRFEFDDERVVCDAGVALVATLAEGLGIEALAGRLVRSRRDRPRAANPGRKLMPLLHASGSAFYSLDTIGLVDWTEASVHNRTSKAPARVMPHRR